MRSPEHDEILAGGNMAGEVRRVRETVRRPTGCGRRLCITCFGAWSTWGFQAAPRALGIDEHAREILSFIPATWSTAGVRSRTRPRPGVSRLP